MRVLSIVLFAFAVLDQQLQGSAQLATNSTDDRSFCDPSTGDCDIVGPQVEFELEPIDMQPTPEVEQVCPDTRPPGLFDCAFHVRRGLCPDLKGAYCQRSCDTCPKPKGKQANKAHEQALGSVSIFVALIAIVAVYLWSRNPDVKSGVLFWITYMILPLLTIIISVLTISKQSLGTKNLQRDILIISSIIFILSVVVYVWSAVLLVVYFKQLNYQKSPNYFEFSMFFLIVSHLMLSLLGIVMSFFGFIE